LDPKIFRTSDVISIFNSVFAAYYEREKYLNTSHFTYSPSYNKFHQLQPVGITPAQSSDLYREDIRRRVLSKNPVKSINEYLKASEKFRYEIYQPSVDNNPSYFKFRDRNTKKNVDHTNFSSGEKTILTVLSWRYMDYPWSGNVSDRTKVVLLDEPDKHLDPKSIEIFMKTIRSVLVDEGVQVIMTTHRPDSVACIKDSELFTITSSSGVKSVQLSNKLLALARLSRNMNGLYNQTTKVYVESFDDVDFYKWMYAHIKMHVYWLLYERSSIEDPDSENTLDQSQKDIKRFSFRYPMSFSSASLSKGESGGFSGVYKLVERTSSDVLEGSSASNEYNDSDNVPIYISNLFEKYKANGTFGLIDRDYEEHAAPAGIHEEVSGSRVVKLARHSLECFMFDPIFFCSILEALEITAESPIKKLSLLKTMRSVASHIEKVRLGHDSKIPLKDLTSLYVEIFELCIQHRDSYLKNFKQKMKKRIAFCECAPPVTVGNSNAITQFARKNLISNIG
jgi:ABC-type multidrug transport system ATPase subunit